MARGAKPKPPSRTPDTSGKRLSRAPLVALLVGACVLSIAAAIALLVLFAELPANQLARVDLSAVSAARERYRGPAAEASVLIATSHGITRAARDPDTLPAAIDDARSRLRLLTSTGLGQLQYVTLVLLQAHLAGDPPDATWKRIGAQFNALLSLPLEHHLPAFIEAERGTWIAAGLTPRAAAIRAESAAASHGVFLQLLATLSRELAHALRVAGDSDGAEQCERALLHALRALVISDGPPELRVPTAALLVQTLRARAPATEAERKAAEACDAWRTAVHLALRGDHGQPAALRGSEPAMASAPRDPARFAVVPLWLGGAGAGAAVVAFAALVVTIARRQPSSIDARSALAALVVILVLSGATFVAVDRAPALVHCDLTRLSSDNAGVPRGPIAWAAVAAVLVIIAVFARRTKLAGTERWTNLAALAGLTWLLLMLATLMVYPHARSALRSAPRGDDSAPPAALARDRDNAARAALRAWTP